MLGAVDRCERVPGNLKPGISLHGFWKKILNGMKLQWMRLGFERTLQTPEEEYEKFPSELKK